MAFLWSEYLVMVAGSSCASYRENYPQKLSLKHILPKQDSTQARQALHIIMLVMIVHIDIITRNAVSWVYG